LVLSKAKPNGYQAMELSIALPLLGFLLGIGALSANLRAMRRRHLDNRRD
jgi:hypothetical protein